MTQIQTKNGQPGVYRSGSITLSDGDGAAHGLDVNGNLKTVSAATGSSADQIQGNIDNHVTDAGNPVKVGGVYRTSPQTLNNLDRGDIQIDVNGNTKMVGNVASGSTDAGSPVKTGGKYNSSAPTLTDGQRGDTQLDVNGNTKVTLATLIEGEDSTNHVMGTLQKPVASSTYSPSTYQQAGSVTKANIKASAGNVYSIRITNKNAAVRYFQLHNKATAPAGTDTAQIQFEVPAGTATNPGVVELTSAFFAPSEYFATGIGWAISTTSGTFTDSATASEHNTTVRYV